MTGILSGPLAQAIGWALLHLMWQGVLVAAILAASLALLQKRSANARYLASCGALILIVALSVVTAYRAYEPVRSYANRAATSVPDTASTKVIATAPAASLDTTPVEITAYASSHMPQIVLIWLLGVTLLSARLILGWLTANRLAGRYARDAEERWQLAMARIADALDVRRAVRLLESAAVEVPTVVGWLRPVVLLPVSIVSGMSAEQIEMILAHELAHIRRHDFIVNLMQSAVETLFFYQPAVWWISRRIRVEREHCCDDLAVALSGDPVRYARALTRFEELRIDAAQTVLAASGGSLVSRVRRLVGAGGESAWSSRWTAGAALLTLVVALFIGPTLPLFANREQQPAPPPSVTPAPALAPKALRTVPPTPAPAPKAKATCGSEIDVSEPMVDVDEDAINDAVREALANQDGIIDAAIEGSAAPIAAAVTASVMPAIASAPEAAARAMRNARVERAFPAFAFAGIGSHKIADEKHLTVDDLIALKTAGITPQYIDQMRSASRGNLSLNDIIALRMQGVNAKYVQDLADAGYKNLTAKELIELRMEGVNAQFVKSLADAGYRNLPVKDLIRLAASGVNADFIRDLAKYRSKQ